MQEFRETEAQISEYNKQIDQKKAAQAEVAEKPEEKIDTEKALDQMDEAYIKYAYWEDMYQNGKASMEGKPGHTGISKKAFHERMRKRNNARAEFQAASLMALKGIGPKDISRESNPVPLMFPGGGQIMIDKYYLEIMGNGALRSFIGDKNMLIHAQPIDMEIMRKLGELGNKDIGLTEEELKHIEPQALEIMAEFGSGLVGDLPKLFFLGASTNFLKAIPIIQRLVKGYKILKNPVLKVAAKPSEGKRGVLLRAAAKLSDETSAYTQAMKGVVVKPGVIPPEVKGGLKALKIVVAADDPVPVGWEVLKVVRGGLKPRVFYGGGVIDELVFTGVGGFAPGMISGMNATHALTNRIRIKGGKVGIAFAPIINALKAGPAATIGMEGGALVAEAVDAWFSLDKDLKDAWDAQWGDLSEAGKHVLAELAVNQMIFGSLQLYTTASVKKLTNPLGGGGAVIYRSSFS
ncbi:hypothetical protein ES705_33289 [subsurface metagenome]